MTTTTTSSRPWTPTDRDRMIFRWIKFEGYKQSWVADQLEINQSTVSRIVERYERWIAHGGPAQQGALTPDERLRAQRWLTYERNEWMLTSALRMAGEMELLSDTSKSTTKHYCSEPSRELEVRTENSIRDRTGMVCRYLRLAHRVGLDQLKLLEKYDLPALEPLLLDEHEYAQAQADAKPKYVDVFPTDSDPLTRRASEDESPSTPNEPAPSADLASLLSVGRGSLDPAPDNSQFTPFGTGLPTSPPARPQVSSTAEPTTHHSPVLPVHNQQPPQPPLTPDSVVTSIEIAPHKKPAAHAYPAAASPPEPTDQLDPFIDATAQEPRPPIRIYPLALPAGAQ